MKSHKSCDWITLQQRQKYARCLDSDDALIVANAMLIIIGRALSMLKGQIEAQGAAFQVTGGFSERLTAVPIEARERNRESSPACPLCNMPMRRRSSAKGNLWGCSGFPDCKGTRPRPQYKVTLPGQGVASIKNLSNCRNEQPAR